MSHELVFSRYQKPLAAFSVLYALLLLFSHWQFPSMYIWTIVLFFSISMNFTYLIESISLNRFVRVEAVLAGSLITASLLGLIVSPLLIIAAILATDVGTSQNTVAPGTFLLLVHLFVFFDRQCL